MVGEVLLYFVERGAAAQVGDPPQRRAGTGHQGGDHLEECLLAPAVPDGIVVQVLRAGAWVEGWWFRPVVRGDGAQSVGGLHGGYRLLVGVRLGVDRQPHDVPFVIAFGILPQAADVPALHTGLEGI